MISVSFGTVASPYAYSSLAPCRMMPPHSCSVPGRKPGTSTRVRIGIPKASQVRTKRAAFSDEAMSSTPASWLGWLPTMPIECPLRRAKPVRMFIAYVGWISKKSPSSTIERITACMSYGLFGLSGMSASSSPHSRSAGSSLGAHGAASRLFCGRNEISARASAIAAASSSQTRWQTPLFSAWESAPPSSSIETSSPVTARTTSGPVMNMCEVSRTIRMKSVMAGE